MRKPKTPSPSAKSSTQEAQRNPVAKFAHYFNKAAAHADKKAYQRRAKHQGREPFANLSPAV